MSVPFLLLMGQITGEAQFFDESVQQVRGFARYLFDEDQKLYKHGYFASRGGKSAAFWGRANGWIAWATSEVLLRLPKSHPGYGEVLALFRQHMSGLAQVQDKSGMWHQVLDHPESYAETSCTAMFVLAMARGVRHGWLEPAYADRAKRGWRAIEKKIDADGTVHGICRGTGMGFDLEFYFRRPTFDHDPRGLGAVISAGIEMAKLP